MQDWTAPLCPLVRERTTGGRKAGRETVNGHPRHSIRAIALRLKLFFRCSLDSYQVLMIITHRDRPWDASEGDASEGIEVVLRSPGWPEAPALDFDRRPAKNLRRAFAGPCVWNVECHPL